MNQTLKWQNRLFVQTGGNLVSDMNGEKVMMSIGNGKYYNLGSVGGRIWELVATPRTVEQIIELLMAEYEIDTERCKDQAEQFLQTLMDERLVQFADAANA